MAEIYIIDDGVKVGYLKEYSEKRIANELFLKIKNTNSKLDFTVLNDGKLTLLKGIIIELEAKKNFEFIGWYEFHQGKGQLDRKACLAKIQDEVMPEINFESESIELPFELLEDYFLYHIDKFGITNISNIDSYYNVDSSQINHNPSKEEIENLIIKTDRLFEEFIVLILYVYYSNEYNAIIQYGGIELDQREKNVKGKDTRKIIILNELGILDNIKLEKGYQDWNPVARDVAKLLNITYASAQSTVNSIKQNTTSPKNPYHNNKQKSIKEFIQDVQKLINRL